MKFSNKSINLAKILHHSENAIQFYSLDDVQTHAVYLFLTTTIAEDSLGAA